MHRIQAKRLYELGLDLPPPPLACEALAALVGNKVPGQEVGPHERAEAERVLRLTAFPADEGSGSEHHRRAGELVRLELHGRAAGPPVLGVDVLGLDGVAVEGHALDAVRGPGHAVGAAAASPPRRGSRSASPMRAALKT